MWKDLKRELEQKREVYVAVKITPSASRNGVKEVMEDGTVKMNIAAPPEKGKANKELTEFIAKELGVAKNNVIIERGKSSKSKTVKVIL